MSPTSTEVALVSFCWVFISRSLKSKSRVLVMMLFVVLRSCGNCGTLFSVSVACTSSRTTSNTSSVSSLTRASSTYIVEYVLIYKRHKFDQTSQPYSLGMDACVVYILRTFVRSRALRKHNVITLILHATVPPELFPPSLIHPSN